MSDQPAADDTHPGARSGHSITPYPGGQALYGGLTFKPPNAETCSSDLYQLNTDSLQWKRVSYCGDAPQRCFAHCAAMVGGLERSLAIFAGMMNGGVLSDDLTVLDDVVGLRPQWRRVPSRGEAQTHRPCARWGHSAVRMPDEQGSMLVFGGMTQGDVALADLWQWSPAGGWRACAGAGAAPAARRRHTATMHNGRMYVFGGRDSSGRHFNDMHLLDVSAMVWRKLSYAAGARPDARVGHAAAVLHGNLVISGGSSQQLSAESGYVVHNDAFAVPLGNGDVDDADRRWERLCGEWDVPQRTMAAAFTVGNSVYVYGGRDTRHCFASLYSIPLPQHMLQKAQKARGRPAARPAAAKAPALVDAAAADAAAETDAPRPPPPRVAKVPLPRAPPAGMEKMMIGATKMPPGYGSPYCTVKRAPDPPFGGHSAAAHPAGSAVSAGALPPPPAACGGGGRGGAAGTEARPLVQRNPNIPTPESPDTPFTKFAKARAASAARDGDEPGAAGATRALDFC